MSAVGSMTVKYASMVGIMSVSQFIEETFGHPFSFWLAAILGATLLRRAIEGPNSTRHGWEPVLLGIAIAWLFTDPALQWLSLDTVNAKPMIAGVLAGTGEYLIRIVFGRDLFARVLTSTVDKYTGTNGKGEDK